MAKDDQFRWYDLLIDVRRKDDGRECFSDTRDTDTSCIERVIQGRGLCWKPRFCDDLKRPCIKFGDRLGRSAGLAPSVSKRGIQVDFNVQNQIFLVRRAELTGVLNAVEMALGAPTPEDWEDRASERPGDEVLEALTQA